MNSKLKNNKQDKLFRVPKDITLDCFEIVLSQPPDCLSDKDDQTLNIGMVDGGGGNFLILSTDRWAVEEKDIDTLANFLKQLLVNFNQNE